MGERARKSSKQGVMASKAAKPEPPAPAFVTIASHQYDLLEGNRMYPSFEFGDAVTLQDEETGRRVPVNFDHSVCLVPGKKYYLVARDTVPTEKPKKAKKHKLPAAPDKEKKTSAYQQFMKASLPDMKAAGIPQKDAFKEAARRWNQLSAEEKQSWVVDGDKAPSGGVHTAVVPESAAKKKPSAPAAAAAPLPVPAAPAAPAGPAAGKKRKQVPSPTPAQPAPEPSTAAKKQKKQDPPAAPVAPTPPVRRTKLVPPPPPTDESDESDASD
eukprot:NODE_680_length_1253_cov_163.500831_g542_i0.p2 GENE.NODE_680_length_1253_cov_163.500831_g542_i0~~NODE_680_length_1253_cov_163.500831_g542_i0.p2  ORF type:complete len:278 (+),score=48.62 NODE_680_length_1253_cov_163.500831_g542_i0:25-834(+)